MGYPLNATKIKELVLESNAEGNGDAVSTACALGTAGMGGSKRNLRPLNRDVKQLSDTLAANFQAEARGHVQDTETGFHPEELWTRATTLYCAEMPLVCAPALRHTEGCSS